MEEIINTPNLTHMFFIILQRRQDIKEIGDLNKEKNKFAG